MDPLSVLASVTGILAVAAKITFVVTGFIAKLKDAPASTHNVVKEISDLSLCLKQLAPFVKGSKHADRSREEVVSVEQVVVLSTSLVLSMSELEKTIDSIGLGVHSSPVARSRWVKEEERLDMMLARIRAAKSSLNLILTIFTCNIVEAMQSSVSSLGSTVDLILQNSTEVLQRLAKLECLAPSMRETLTLRPSSLPEDYSRLPESPKDVDDTTPIADQGTHILQFDPNLESEIYASRVYMRNKQRHSLSSLSTVHVSIAGTSFLSGISLAQVSNISVLSLPVFSHELWHSEQYTTEHDSNEILRRSNPVYASAAAYNESVSSSTLEEASVRTTAGSGLRYNETWYRKASIGLFKSRLGGGPTREARRSAEIDRKLKADSRRAQRSVKILLLGIGEAGKSTVLKQMRLRYSAGPPLQERIEERQLIISNILVAMNLAFESMKGNGISYERDVSLRHELVVKEAHAQEIYPESYLTQDVAESIKALLLDGGFREIIKKGHQYALHDNFGYYTERIDHLSCSWYLPSDNDFLHSGRRTSGITDTLFEVGELDVHVFDVGGARSERKKYVHVFENCHNLVFVAAFRYLQNQMKESLLLFESLLGLAWFRRSRVTLLLTKLDLYEKKIKQSPIHDYFPDFEGDSNDSGAGRSYFIGRFLSLNKDPERKIDVFCADVTDSERFSPIFQAIMNATFDNAVDMVSS